MGTLKSKELLEEPLTAFGVHQKHSSLLRKELGISTCGDLIEYFPFRYEDYSKFSCGDALDEGAYIYTQAVLAPFQWLGTSKRPLLQSRLRVGTTSLLLVWFNGTRSIRDHLKPGTSYAIRGKVTSYKGQLAIVHPALSPPQSVRTDDGGIVGIYSSTMKLSRLGLDSRGIRRLLTKVLQRVRTHIPETLPASLITRYRLLPRAQALVDIHFPSDFSHLAAAQRRLKFEEIFFLQWKISCQQQILQGKRPSFSFSSISLVHQFCREHMTFSLTAAQKKAIKEIRMDMKGGRQMNRLLQGDVGSGKTVVSFIAALLPIADKAQVVVMAPTELLAAQHAQTFADHGMGLGLNVALLTGSTPAKERKKILGDLRQGAIDILVGTHALLESQVRFGRLGLVIIDEQHRFGVAQRARLWYKESDDTPPHLLAMTATPIPRTLAMTLYRDLDVSLIKELPRGRKPVRTYHIKEGHRSDLFSFLSRKIAAGRQIYMVYPLIEKSEKRSYKYLLDGYRKICERFPDLPVGILHGRMKARDKSHQMEQFVKGKTRIMVTTTVIEVGVNVPNATVMVIENAEQFGLVQLHQLRGRIRRGQEEGYCFLVTTDQLNDMAKKRIKVMCTTSDGFHIAEMDLKLRGHGNLVGLEQSGLFQMKLADLNKDIAMVREAQKAVAHIQKEDPELIQPVHAPLRRVDGKDMHWERVS